MYNWADVRRRLKIYKIEIVMGVTIGVDAEKSGKNTHLLADI